MDQQSMDCREKRRRKIVREKHLNGIDYVEVRSCINNPNGGTAELCVHFFHDVSNGEGDTIIDAANIVIEGGRRIRMFTVKANASQNTTTTTMGCCPENENCFSILVSPIGDYSIYTLRLAKLSKERKPTHQPPDGFDMRYASAQFSFKVDCPSDLDCKNNTVCPPEKRDEPEINYLAKDYAGFRQLILDRLALLMPDWKERHIPDIGIALVEVLAYVGDYLSYYQDAVATEAYLNTARKRISVRRHAKLVDYQMHEGCNARALVTVKTKSDFLQDDVKLKDIYFGTSGEDDNGLVFEPMEGEKDAKFYSAHNEIKFYTWGDEECCLPKGATSATLVDSPSTEQSNDPPAPAINVRRGDRLQNYLHVNVHDILIFEEVIGPKTDNHADANPASRWAVRLTKVKPGIDPLTNQAIVEIEWREEDALPFTFCLSTRLPSPVCRLIENVTVARGNVVLVDHGKTVDHECLGQVGAKEKIGDCSCEGSAIEMTVVPDMFAPVVKKSPLTFTEKLPDNLPASLLMRQEPHKAVPCVVLESYPGVCPDGAETASPDPCKQINDETMMSMWFPKQDLLESTCHDRNFVVEIDDNAAPHLRFGDGELGMLPEACAIFKARYRIGNGSVGNVGAETITRLKFRSISIDTSMFYPRNPLPAQGGQDPESIDQVKLFAPGAFRKELRRAITPADYAAIAMRDFKSALQSAAASLQWTGSWYEADVAIDPLGNEESCKKLLRNIEHDLHKYRRIGHDLKVVPAEYVPLDIELCVCVKPHFFRGHVEAALLAVFGNTMLPSGDLGFFHPDNLTFGSGIFLSKIVAKAQAVTGVESVTVKKLQRFREGDRGEITNGVLPLGPFEIAQLDNDPSFPEHGKLTITLTGGR